MGARRHGQEGSLISDTYPPCGNVVMCFCALVVTAKRSIDELFMHCFHKLSSAMGAFQSHWGSITGPRLGTFGQFVGE